MIDYVFLDYLLKSIANYGFPACFCLALYFDLRKEIRANTEATLQLIDTFNKKI